MLLTLISTYMQNIIWILLVNNLFLAANVCKYTVRYAVRLPYNIIPYMCLVQRYNIITVDVFKIDILLRYSNK